MCSYVSIINQQPTHSYLLISALYFLTVTLLGCQGGIYIFRNSSKELIHNALDSYDYAEAVIMRGGTLEERKD